MGHGSAILLGFSFPVFTRVHLQHHIHVNHPKNDPDHIVSTFGPIWLIAPRFFYHEVFFFQRKLWRRYELLQWGIERSIFITIILAGLKFDFMNLIYNLWFGPALMVGVTLGIFFDYLPHRPFRSRNKWINSRVYPSKFMNLLIMGQNYHLIHHLWPSIPWFEYKIAYEKTKPLLDKKGSPQRVGIFESKEDIFAEDHLLEASNISIHIELQSPIVNQTQIYPDGENAIKDQRLVIINQQGYHYDSLIAKENFVGEDLIMKVKNSLTQ